MTQNQLRSVKRQARKALSPQQRQEFSQHIAERFLRSKTYQNAKRIGTYFAMPDEVSMQMIINTAWADSKQIYLPVVIAKDQAMSFAPYSQNSKLIKDMVNICVPEVDKDDYLSAQQLDVVLTPLVAFDEQCNRIGMGGGFYDRSFAFKRDNQHACPILIGAAFETQKTDEKIITGEWDVALDKVISEAKIYLRNNV